MSGKTLFPTGESYFALDELLDHPQVRALDALRFQDWVSATELGEHLGEAVIGKSKGAARGRENFTQHMVRLRKRGFVDRKEEKGTWGGGLYRITKAGRDAFAGIFTAYRRALESGR
jgi:DNA-binding transcriptional ArsR family regulator